MLKKVNSFIVIMMLVASADIFAQSAEVAPLPETGLPSAIESNNEELLTADDKPEQKKAPTQGAVKVGTAVAGKNNGIALNENGRARLHVGIDFATGFSLNPYSIPLSRMLTNFSGDMVVRVRPNMQIAYPGSLLSFDMNAFVDYGFLPGLVNTSTRNFLLLKSKLEGGLEINKGGALSFAVRDQIGLNNEPGYITNGSLYTSVSNILRLGASYAPGGGTLNMRLLGNFGVKKYFDWIGPSGLGNTGYFGKGSAIRTDIIDNISAGLKGRIDWRFLPKTGMFAELGSGIHMYPFSTNPSATPMSFPTFLSLGMMGQFTSQLSGLAKLGYYNPLTYSLTSFTNVLLPSSNFDSLSIIGVTAMFELRWKPIQTTEIAGGFSRRIAPSALYQHLTNNRLYLKASQKVGKDFKLSADTGYSVLLFGRDLSGFVNPDTSFNSSLSQGSRIDGNLNVGLEASYQLTSWMSLAINNTLGWRLSNSSIKLKTNEQLNLSFVQNQTLLLMSISY